MTFIRFVTSPSASLSSRLKVGTMKERQAPYMTWIFLMLLSLHSNTLSTPAPCARWCGRATGSKKEIEGSSAQAARSHGLPRILFIGRNPSASPGRLLVLSSNTIDVLGALGKRS
jgi:hypothetical protein